MMTNRFASGGIRPRLVVVVACVAVMLVSGCSAKAPTSSWTPTTKTLPPVSPDSAPSGSVPSSVAPSDSALYQQALDVYNKFFALDAQVQAQAGADELPPDLAALLTGSALYDETRTYQNAKALGYYWVGMPQFHSDKVAQLTSGLPENTDIALQACETTSGAELWNASGRQISDGSPSTVLHYYYMQYDDQHSLLIFQLSGKRERIETCPI